PTHAPHVPVFATSWVIAIVGLDDAVANDVRAPAFGKNEVADLHLTGELPACQRVVSRKGSVVAPLGESSLDRVQCRKCRQVAEVVPTDCGDRVLTEIVP